MSVQELEASMMACRNVIRSCETVCELALSAACNAPDKDEEQMRTLFHKTKETLAKANCEYYRQKEILEEAKALYARQTNTTRNVEQTNAIRSVDLTNATRIVG
jgi:hypothetical protein